MQDWKTGGTNQTAIKLFENPKGCILKNKFIFGRERKCVRSEPGLPQESSIWDNMLIKYLKIFYVLRKVLSEMAGIKWPSLRLGCAPKIICNKRRLQNGEDWNQMMVWRWKSASLSLRFTGKGMKTVIIIFRRWCKSMEMFSKLLLYKYKVLSTY